MKRDSIRVAIRIRRMTLDNIAFLRERWDCHSLSETIRRAVNEQAEAERKNTLIEQRNNQSETEA